jgi:hypothetical protein
MRTMNDVLYGENSPDMGLSAGPSAIGAGAPNAPAGSFSTGFNIGDKGRVGSILGSGLMGGFGPVGSALGAGFGGALGGWGKGKSIGTGIGSLVGSGFGPLGSIAGGYLGGQIGGGAFSPETNALGQVAQSGWGNQFTDRFGNPVGSLSNIASVMNTGNPGVDAADNVGMYTGQDFEGEGYDGSDGMGSNDNAGTSDGIGGGADAGWSDGGMVNPGMLSGPNPPGPDDGYGALDHGEGVLTAKAMDDLGAGNLAKLNKSKKSRQMVKALLG